LVEHLGEAREAGLHVGEGGATPVTDQFQVRQEFADADDQVALLIAETSSIPIDLRSRVHASRDIPEGLFERIVIKKSDVNDPVPSPGQ
jgi:hypothetical protein